MVETKTKKCAACDIERASYSVLEAFALGLAIGRVVEWDGLDADLVCSKHRHRFVHAQLQATAKMSEDYDATA